MEKKVGGRGGEERIGSRWWEEDGCLLCPSRT